MKKRDRLRKKADRRQRRLGRTYARRIVGRHNWASTRGTTGLMPRRWLEMLKACCEYLRRQGKLPPGWTP